MPETTSSQQSKVLTLLHEKGLLRSYELGVARSTLQRLVETGVIERVARGLYALPGQLLSEHQSLLEVSKQIPDGITCLLSALSFHGIGTQLPNAVWVAIGSKARTPTVKQVAVRIVRFSPKSLVHGVERHTIRGVELRVTSPAKTVVDCFKFRNKIGLDVAVEALRVGWQDRRFRPSELADAARVCRVEQVMRPYLETLL